MWMPFSASSGRSRSSKARVWRSHRSTIRSRSSSITCDGVRPSGPGSLRPASTWSCTPATRIMKNSSRFEQKIAENFSRSSSGSSDCSESSRTRSLNDSHESSRLS